MFRNNKRKSERISPIDSDCIFKIAGGSSDGLLIDKSEEGIRVGKLDLLILFADQQVVVETADEIIVGRCRCVSRQPDGTFQVGILREPEEFDDDSDSILLNSFVHLGDDKVVCIPSSIHEFTMQICLLNNEEIEVHVDQVEQLTREERLDELCDENCLAQAMISYEIEDTGNSFADRTTVLNHEFGPAIKPYKHMASEIKSAK